MPFTDIRWLSGAMSIRPLPTPATAVTIGSAIASSDPNAMSRMTAAAPMPIADALDSGACSVFEMALPAKLDRKARLPGGGRHRDHPVDVGLVQVVRRLGEVHRGVRGAPVRAYLDLAARQVGAGDRGHLGQVRHPREHRGHPLLDGADR